MIVDLSHTITAGMTTYPGLDGPELFDVMSRDQSAARFGSIRMHIGRICMVANTGTYVDVPFHFFEDGAHLAEVTIGALADVPGVLIDVSGLGVRGIPTEVLEGIDIRHRAVLIRTGWDRYFGTPQYGIDAPFLTHAAVNHLLAGGVALVGIDSVNIDDIGDLTRPAHCGFLRAGIPIVEHLTNLHALAHVADFTFTAAPPKVAALGTFPVRAFARIEP